jgi:hypothetical protein
VKSRACAELEHTNNHREEADIVTPSTSSENAAEEKKEDEVESEQTELLSLEMVSMPAVVNNSSHQEKGEEGETEGGGGDVRQLVDQMTVNYAKFRSLFFFFRKGLRNYTVGMPRSNHEPSPV